MEGEEDVERCPVCLDAFDDPVMCLDGHAYCRLCAGRWSRGQQRWRSVRTNADVEGPCALVADWHRHIRACATKSAAVLSAATVPEQVYLAATVRSGAVPCASAAQAGDALRRALEDDGPGLRACHPMALLELASRCDRLDALPSGVVLAALRADRSDATAPLLQLEVLQRLRAAQRARLVATAVDRHLCFRAGACDAVRIPPGRATVTGVFFRAASAPPLWAVFESADGGSFRVAALPSHYYGPHETREGAVVERASLRHVFTSEESLPWRPDAFWPLRRGRPPFPDHDGADSSGTEAARGSVPPCVTIFEQELVFLPSGLGYEASAEPRRPRCKRDRS